MLAWVGGIVRLITVCLESDDLFFKSQFVISVLLNTAIIVQFGLYWNSDKVEATKKTADAGAKPDSKKNK